MKDWLLAIGIVSLTCLTVYGYVMFLTLFTSKTALIINAGSFLVGITVLFKGWITRVRLESEEEKK